ncbi:OsmC family protein [Candidatus Chlorohelix sp.]|uniref:OsmC family protein n=1 Tax=Candidatus Chlorohelix sp. TaxID=3139201 RepID=UPI0030219741
MVKEVIVNWESGMKFTATAESGFTVIMDTKAEFGGSDEGFTPKMLLLVSLAGCTAMDVISMLKKMRQEVSGYRLEVKGWEHEEHPKKFDRIVVEHVVEGHNLSQESVDKAIGLSHEKYCSVSASLAGSVEIVMTSRLVETGSAIA